MKLTEVQASPADTLSGGKAATGFVDYLEDMEKHFSAEHAQRLRQVAAHLIKSGFTFGKIPNTLFGNLGFFKGPLIVHMPVKAQSKKAQGKVVVSYGSGSHYEVSLAKAARVDYPALVKAMEELEAARAAVKAMLK